MVAHKQKIKKKHKQHGRIIAAQTSALTKSNLTNLCSSFYFLRLDVCVCVLLLFFFLNRCAIDRSPMREMIVMSEWWRATSCVVTSTMTSRRWVGNQPRFTCRRRQTAWCCSCACRGRPSPAAWRAPTHSTHYRSNTGEWSAPSSSWQHWWLLLVVTTTSRRHGNVDAVVVSTRRSSRQHQWWLLLVVMTTSRRHGNVDAVAMATRRSSWQHFVVMATLMITASILLVGVSLAMAEHIDELGTSRTHVLLQCQSLSIKYLHSARSRRSNLRRWRVGDSNWCAYDRIWHIICTEKLAGKLPV